jgi:hypothetical protein
MQIVKQARNPYALLLTLTDVDLHVEAVSLRTILCTLYNLLPIKIITFQAPV